MPQWNDTDVPQTGFEAWRDCFRTSAGARYTLECAEPDTFSGWVRPFNMFGLPAMELGSNRNRIERTQRDARLDGVDYYGVLFQLAGHSTASHNGQTIHLAEGDVALIDKTRPASYATDSEAARWLFIPFPRWPLISHLGFEPRPGSYKHAGTPAARLLYELVLASVKEDDEQLAMANCHMQHAIYSLVGALFVPDSWCGSRPTDRLFGRMREIIRDRIADPDFGPQELATDAGISLRYVHKLFAERGFSCQKFIYSCRLDHAANLLNRRPGKAQPLSEIARACGFCDYTHFARRFRNRFGHAPGALTSQDHASDHNASNDGVRSSIP